MRCGYFSNPLAASKRVLYRVDWNYVVSISVIKNKIDRTKINTFVLWHNRWRTVKTNLKKQPNAMINARWPVVNLGVTSWYTKSTQLVLLERFWIKCIAARYSENFTFRQDDAPVHHSRQIVELLRCRMPYFSVWIWWTMLLKFVCHTATACLLSIHRSFQTSFNRVQEPNSLSDRTVYCSNCLGMSDSILTIKIDSYTNYFLCVSNVRCRQQGLWGCWHRTAYTVI